MPPPPLVGIGLKQDPHIDLGFWSFLTILHHSKEDVETPFSVKIALK